MDRIFARCFVLSFRATYQSSNKSSTRSISICASSGSTSTICVIQSAAGFILETDISEMGEAVAARAKTAVLPVWTCGLGRTVLAVEVRNAYWRQFHATRVQAFNHATVFPRDSTAKPLHIRAAISSQGEDRKSTRLNSSHPSISYAVFCLKK